jgi:hypothetical protein
MLHVDSIGLVGRTVLIQRHLAELERGEIKIVNNAMSRLACQQLADLVVEDGDSGHIYKCASGRHDDLGISCAIVAWAARHPHLEAWVRTASYERKPRQTFGWGAFT